MNTSNRGLRGRRWRSVLDGALAAFLGASIPAPLAAADQVPATTPGASIEIVVKFKDDAGVKDIIDAFWKTPHEAKVKFDAFKKSRPELAEFVLDRVTYSNELVLVLAQKSTPDGHAIAMRALAQRISSSPGVSYAEPVMIAHPGAKP